MQSHKKVLWPTVAAIAIAGGSYFGSLGLNHNFAAAESPAATARPTPAPHSEAVAPAEDLSRAFRSVHNALKDAVVNIQVVQKIQRPLKACNANLNCPKASISRRDSPSPTKMRRLRKRAGTGSGVIVFARRLYPHQQPRRRRRHGHRGHDSTMAAT